jgi:hypothetical protein
MDKFDYFKQIVDTTDPRHTVDIRRLQSILQEAEDRYIKSREQEEKFLDRLASECTNPNS